DQLVVRHDVPAVEEQDRQELSLLAAPDRDRVVAVANLEWPQDQILHRLPPLTVQPVRPGGKGGRSYRAFTALPPFRGCAAGCSWRGKPHRAVPQSEGDQPCIAPTGSGEGGQSSSSPLSSRSSLRRSPGPATACRRV